jgi:hypothetical protein
MSRQNFDPSEIIAEIDSAIKKRGGFKFTFSNGLKGTLYRLDQKQVRDIAEFYQGTYPVQHEKTTSKFLQGYWIIQLNIKGEEVYLLFYSEGSPYWYVNMARADVKRAIDMCTRILYRSNDHLTLCWLSEDCWPVLKGAILKKIQPSIYILLYKQKGR